MKIQKFGIKDLIPFAISVLFALSIFVLDTNTSLFVGLENMSLNFRFFMREPDLQNQEVKLGVSVSQKNPKSSDDIVLLAINEETIRHFGESGIEWPFPWKEHATFLEFVGTGKPNSILVDIMFLDHKVGEEALAKAINKADSVFLDYALEKMKIDKPFSDHAERMANLAPYSWKAPASDTRPDSFQDIIPPTPLLGEAAKGLGYANVEVDSDKVTRKSLLVTKYKGRYYPNIVLSVVMNYYGVSFDDVELKRGEYIKLHNIDVSKRIDGKSSNVLIIPVNEDFQMDTNYIGTHGAFNTMPYYYFHRNEGSLEGAFEGKILLVAAYAVTGIAHDIEMSPFGEMFGIEHHAHAINTIITQDFLKRPSNLNNLILMLAIAVIIGLILPRLSIIVSTLVTVAMTGGYLVYSHYAFEHSNLITAYSVPAIQIIFNYILITTIRIVTEQSEKRYIRKTFSKFVSKSVVDELLKHPDKLKLGGDKKILSVLFSDIRGFTTISEQLTPEQLVEHLNDYLQAMTDIVIKYDGTLDKYIGDAIMAFWSAPIEQKDHAVLACKAALEMLESLDPLNEKWKSEGKPPLNIGIGINSGDMVVANMGSSSRMDYTIMGDNVNLGSRVEGVNKQYGTRLIIAENTYELVKDRAIVRELDLIRVKGKKEPVHIYELVDIE